MPFPFLKLCFKNRLVVRTDIDRPDRGERYDRKNLSIAICFGLLGPSKPWLYALQSSKNKHRIAKKRGLAATIHFSPFTCCFRELFSVHSRLFAATRTPNSHNHSYLHYSLCKFTGEWFHGRKRLTNHSDHIHIFTPITRIVATKGWAF